MIQSLEEESVVSSHSSVSSAGSFSRLIFLSLKESKGRFSSRLSFFWSGQEKDDLSFFVLGEEASDLGVCFLSRQKNE